MNITDEMVETACRDRYGATWDKWLPESRDAEREKVKSMLTASVSAAPAPAITNEQIEAARKAAPVHLGPALDSTIRGALIAGLSAGPQAVVKPLDWNRADGEASTLLYTLRENGWRKGEPVLINDVMVRVEKSPGSQADLEPIIARILSALTTTPAQAVGVPEGWKLVPVVGLDPYDAGLLNDWGGGNIEWWQDYIRNELERAHEYYVAQITTPPADQQENDRLTRIAHQLPYAEECVRLEEENGRLKRAYQGAQDNYQEAVEENERLRQRLNHYIKATIDKNSDLIAAEAHVKALEDETERLRAQLNMATDEMTDVVSILSCVDGFQQTVDSINATIRAIEGRAALKGGEANG